MKVELMSNERKPKIKKSLVNSTNRTPEDSSRNFAKLMWQGKVSARLKLLNSDYDNSVLKVDDNVFKDLQEKHSKHAPIKEGSLLQGPINKVPASYWDAIDDSMIATATRLTNDSGGSSQLDGEQFRLIILSKKFKKVSKDLREQVVLLATTPLILNLLKLLSHAV